MSAKSKRFIADLVPRFPIYIELLPKQVQDVIGKANELTIPALKLLERKVFVLRIVLIFLMPDLKFHVQLNKLEQ